MGAEAWNAVGVISLFAIIPASCYWLFAFLDWVTACSVTKSPAMRRHIRVWFLLPGKRATTFDEYMAERASEPQP